MLNFYSKELPTKSDVKSFIKTAAEMVEIMATENAEKFGYGRDVILSHGGFWVILKIRFAIENYPENEGEIIAETWPLPPGRLKVERQYRLKDLSGNILINAASEWCVLGLENRRPIRMETDVFSGGHEYLCEKSGAGEFSRINEPVIETDFCYERKIEIGDIDLNNHTNNKKYTDMVLQCFSDECLKEKPIKFYELHFLKETYLGDKIKIYKTETEKGIVVSGLCENTPVFKAVIEF